MKYILIIIIANIHLIGFEFIDGADWYVMQFCSSVCIFLLFGLLFRKTDKYNVSERSGIAIIMLYVLYGLLTYWPWVFNQEFSILPFYIIFSLVVVRSIMIGKRDYKHHSDPINENNYYICLERPHKTRGVFTSLIGFPFSSVCIYSEGQLYGFKWTKKSFLKRTVQPRALLKKYIIINTGVSVIPSLEKELEKIIGAPASRYIPARIRCVWVIRNFLDRLGKEYKPSCLEYIPSIYSKKVIGIRNEKTVSF